MPNYGLSGDPNEQLRSFLEGTTPVTYGGGISRPSTEAEDAYADQPNREAILHYLNTGQMPTTVRQPDPGLVGHLGALLGLRTLGPVPTSQYTQDRAGLAKKQMEQAHVEQQLREMQAIQPGVEQFGSDYGRAAMHAIDPRLESVYPKGMKGKGEIAQQGQEMKFELGQMANEAKMAQVQAQAALAEARAAAAGGNLAIAQQKLELAQMLGQLAERRATEGPMNTVISTMTASLDRRERDIRTRMDKLDELGPVPDDDPRKIRLQSELDNLEEQRLRLSTAGDSKAYETLRKIMMPESGTPKPPPTTGGAYKPLSSGIFGGSGGGTTPSGITTVPRGPTGATGDFSVPTPTAEATPAARPEATPVGKYKRPKPKKPESRATPKPRYD